ncbi:aminotransferase class I/II-fold pyridoxal phosphate-dependent enzyme, partial [Pseudomonadota bacterium]|nr:aminotransferase class I/II-fold pyridoxal phosphate-dependent enzyme [Pseudomonadota bacterium]
ASDPGLIAWYPDCLALNLTDAISKFVNVSSNNILTFPGSDVGLETLCRAYLNPTDTVVALCPTYENFFVYVNQMGSDLKKLVLDEPFIFDYELISKTLKSSCDIKMFYLANPNNPCGYSVQPEFIEKLLVQFPEILFVIDEAYIEFTNIESTTALSEKYSNIAIFRTFSKAFGLAGLRLGYVCAPIDIICNINKIRNGKNISMVSQKIGIFALENFSQVDRWINEVIKSREIFEKWCERNNIKYYPSDGNFVLFRVGMPIELCSSLKAKGIYIRNRDSVIPGCVRATFGSRSQTKKLIKALEKLNKFVST